MQGVGHVTTGSSWSDAWLRTSRSLCGKSSEDSFSESPCGGCLCQHLRFLFQRLELSENIVLNHAVCRSLSR